MKDALPSLGTTELVDGDICRRAADVGLMDDAGFAVDAARDARFFAGRVCVDKTWSPLIFGFGQSRSQEQNAAAVGNLERSGPISVRSICAVRVFIPGTCVRSMPNAL
jgi:hypothetical protein